MNLKNNILLILVTLVLISHIIVHEFKIEERIVVEQQVCNLDSLLYDLTIKHIKQSEGLRLKPYYCPSGRLTIGYGHVFKSGNYIGEIDSNFAHNLLVHDFNSRLKLTPDSLPFHQRLAFTHFIFGFGYSTLLKSTFYKQHLKGEFIGFGLLQYTKYKNNKGVYVHSNNLKKSRNFELNLYYANYKELLKGVNKRDTF